MAHRLSAAVKQAWTAMAGFCWTVIFGSQHAYRPEAHYMRGPGPKWREKHGNTAP